jgi:hypothetical protein
MPTNLKFIFTFEFKPGKENNGCDYQNATCQNRWQSNPQCIIALSSDTYAKPVYTNKPQKKSSSIVTGGEDKIMVTDLS